MRIVSEADWVASGDSVCVASAEETTAIARRLMRISIENLRMLQRILVAVSLFFRATMKCPVSESVRKSVQSFSLEFSFLV